ncbi:MAG: amidohydrolase [Pseudomonadota bacterium]
MAVPQPILDMHPEVTEWRQHLHMHPEVGYKLPKTTKFVADKLRGFGFDRVAASAKEGGDPRRGVAECGVVGVLKGKRRGARRSIMLRADMDALPIQELNDFAHKSKTDGKFHGCGHDGHTACLLGAAKHLATHRNFHGTVYFCFQPAEEGGAGARAMMEAGLFRKFPCQAIYGAHNWPTMPVGMMGFRDGPMLAASNEFWITIKGQGGHAARPHQAHDPLVVGAQLVMDLQTVISRMRDPVETAVLSVTEFHAGTTTNVIPGEARLSGTLRSFSSEMMQMMVDAIDLKCREISLSEHFEATVKFSDAPYPPLANTTREYQRALSVGQQVTQGKVVPQIPLAMGSEDFAYYLQHDTVTGKAKPGCFMIFGNGDSKMLHNPHYDFNDAAIPHMVHYWTSLVETALPIQE